MIALLQRVSHAKVEVGQQCIGRIGQGLLVFLGVEKEDTQHSAQQLLQRVLGYRVFEDRSGRMNHSLVEADGGLLIVPQFTLAADTRKGRRPGFSTAAPPDKGQRLFEYFTALARQAHHTVASGKFGANMQVSLTNDGPVTFWLQSRVS